MVTRFQQAILQEMGIPLWKSQDDVQAEPATQPSSQERQVADPEPLSSPRSENSSSHLAAIRASLSGKTTSSDLLPSEMSPSEVSPSEVSPSEVPPSEVSPSEVSPNEVSPRNAQPDDVAPSEKAATQQSESARPLRPEERELTIVKDITLAFETVGKPMPATIEIGGTLAVTAEQVMLPASPAKLTTADKKQLWACIAIAANGHGA